MTAYTREALDKLGRSGEILASGWRSRVGHLYSSEKSKLAKRLGRKGAGLYPRHDSRTAEDE